MNQNGKYDIRPEEESLMAQLDCFEHNQSQINDESIFNTLNLDAPDHHGLLFQDAVGVESSSGYLMDVDQPDPTTVANILVEHTDSIPNDANINLMFGGQEFSMSTFSPFPLTANESSNAQEMYSATEASNASVPSMTLSEGRTYQNLSTAESKSLLKDILE